MKCATYLLLLFPLFSTAQTTEDYKKTMSKFMDFYNSDNIDSMCTLFRFNPELKDGCFWKAMKDTNPKSHEAWGKIVSYRYLGMFKPKAYDRVAFFKVDYTKQKGRLMFFSLHSNGRFGTFTFDGGDADEEQKQTERDEE